MLSSNKSGKSNNDRSGGNDKSPVKSVESRGFGLMNEIASQSGSFLWEHAGGVMRKAAALRWAPVLSYSRSQVTMHKGRMEGRTEHFCRDASREETHTQESFNICGSWGARGIGVPRLSKEHSSSSDGSSDYGSKSSNEANAMICDAGDAVVVATTDKDNLSELAPDMIPASEVSRETASDEAKNLNEPNIMTSDVDVATEDFLYELGAVEAIEAIPGKYEVFCEETASDEVANLNVNEANLNVNEANLNVNEAESCALELVMEVIPDVYEVPYEAANDKVVNYENDVTIEMRCDADGEEQQHEPIVANATSGNMVMPENEPDVTEEVTNPRREECNARRLTSEVFLDQTWEPNPDALYYSDVKCAYSQRCSDVVNGMVTGCITISAPLAIIKEDGKEKYGAKWNRLEIRCSMPRACSEQFNDLWLTNENQVVFPATRNWVLMGDMKEDDKGYPDAVKNEVGQRFQKLIMRPLQELSEAQSTQHQQQTTELGV